MSSLTGSLAAFDSPSRSRPGRAVALVLAVLTPLILAVAALATVSAGTSAAPQSAPLLPAAIVNLDTPITTTVNGTSTPVAAGKLLTTQLSQNGAGFAWTITDAASADAGLRTGGYAAVVTIPSGFSAAYISSSGPNPVQASLTVQTNGATNYLVQQLATALSSTIQTSLSSQLTQNFVKGLLVGFTDLHGQLGEAATGAGQLAQGTSSFVGYLQDAANGSGELADGADELADGLSQLAAGAALLPGATRDLAGAARLAADGAGLLDRGVNDLLAIQIDIDARQLAADVSLSDLLHRVQTDPNITPEQIAEALQDIQTQTRDIQALSATMSAGLAAADLGTNVLSAGSGLVADGAQALAGGMPDLAQGAADAAQGGNALADGVQELSSGLQQLASGGGTLSSSTSQLAGGLAQAAAAIPSYTTAQQQSLSSVVAAPIQSAQSDVGSAPNARSALAGVIVPLVLWLGTLALFVVLVPVTPEALRSSASSWRIVTRSLAPAVLLALVQALLVVMSAVLLGFRSGHHLAAVGLIVLMSVSFALVHHGLVTAFGRAGRVASIAFLAVQVLAAGVVIPLSFGANWLSGISGLLPLAQSIRGLQAAITGGDLGVVLSVAFALVVLALAGVALSTVSTARRRWAGS